MCTHLSNFHRAAFCVKFFRRLRHKQSLHLFVECRKFDLGCLEKYVRGVCIYTLQALIFFMNNKFSKPF